MRFSCEKCGSCCSRLMARSLTLADIARLGELFEDVELKKLVASFVCVLDYETDDAFTQAAWFSRLKNGKKVTLALHSWGPCQFLNDKECFVHSHRPWMCRMFPFWFDPELKVRTAPRRYCVSLQHSPEPEPAPLLEKCALAASPERVHTLEFFRSSSGKHDVDGFVDAVTEKVLDAKRGAMVNLALFQEAEKP